MNKSKMIYEDGLPDGVTSEELDEAMEQSIREEEKDNIMDKEKCLELGRRLGAVSRRIEQNHLSINLEYITNEWNQDQFSDNLEQLIEDSNMLATIINEIKTVN